MEFVFQEFQFWNWNLSNFSSLDLIVGHIPEFQFLFMLDVFQNSYVLTFHQ